MTSSIASAAVNLSAGTSRGVSAFRAGLWKLYAAVLSGLGDEQHHDARARQQRVDASRPP